MKIAQPKRIKDQLGRPGGILRIHLLSLAFFATLFGSVWPASARSLDPAYDSAGTAREFRMTASRFPRHPSVPDW